MSVSFFLQVGYSGPFKRLFHAGQARLLPGFLRSVAFFSLLVQVVLQTGSAGDESYKAKDVSLS